MSDLWVRDAVSGDVEALLAIYRQFVVETAVSFELAPPLAVEFAQRIVTAQWKWACPLRPAAAGLCRQGVLHRAGITLPNEASIRRRRWAASAEVGVFRRAGRKFGVWHDVSRWQRALREEPPTKGA